MSAPFLILASASPRRVELLRELHIPFEVIPSEAEELHDHSIPARDICVLNAALKAGWVADRYPDRLVIGADTLVTLDNQLFGKPASREEAEQILWRLQGKTHQVITGVSLQNHATGFTRNFSDVTEVSFKPLSMAQIREYIGKVHVLDKAGAYAIQEHGEMIVASITGSYTNVVGLPVPRLKVELGELRGRFPGLLENV